MPLHEVCRHIRSKAAGPFWVTIDIFFDSKENFTAYARHPKIGVESFGSVYGVDPAMVKRTVVDSLRMVKVSYPRPNPQGWSGERDMHQGQSYTRILELRF
jgi:hypothetical protein